MSLLIHRYRNNRQPYSLLLSYHSNSLLSLHTHQPLSHKAAWFSYTTAVSPCILVCLLLRKTRLSQSVQTVCLRDQNEIKLNVCTVPISDENNCDSEELSSLVCNLPSLAL